MASGEDFLSNLLGGHGCNDDGTTSRNPITTFVDNIFNNQMLMISSSNGNGTVGMHTQQTTELNNNAIGMNMNMNMPPPQMMDNMNNEAMFDEMWRNQHDGGGNGGGMMNNMSNMQNVCLYVVYICGIYVVYVYIHALCMPALVL